MPYIELSGKRGRGKRCLVDEKVFEQFGHLPWHLSDTGYAVRRGIMDDGTKMTQRLHRLVVDAPEHLVVDHLNHDRLDNRKSNLRVCTQKINAQNTKNEKGYTWDASKSKYMVRYRGAFHGRYKTEAEAKRAYQMAKSGVPYEKTRRKYWHLPTGVSKQFGRYRVCPQKNGVKHWLGSYRTVEEAEQALNEWKNRG